jgi:hypothetical protein
MADADHEDASDRLVATLASMADDAAPATRADVTAVYSALVRVVDAQMATVTALSTRKTTDIMNAAIEIGKATDAVKAGINRLPARGRK